MRIPESILRKIDFVLTLKDSANTKRAVEEVISDLESLSCGKKNPEVNYLLGYSWYLHPDRQHSKQIEAAVEQALLSSVKQDPNNARAWLYLGHNAYDFGRYELAMERFKNVDLDEFSPYFQLKTQEMILCCKIRLDGLSMCLGELEQFVSIADQSQIEDLWPQELARTIAGGLKAVEVSERTRLKTATNRLDAAGNFGNWFSEIIGEPD